MNELLSKISSYNLFTNLFPGAVFSVIAEHRGVIGAPDDWTSKLIWFYFCGMVISRVGSVALEPILRLIGYISHGPYADFLAASKTDEKLQIMVEVANTYRTLAATFLILLLAEPVELGLSMLGIERGWQEIIGLFALALLFLVSLRKQNSFINKRSKAGQIATRANSDGQGGIDQPQRATTTQP